MVGRFDQKASIMTRWLPTCQKTQRNDNSNKISMVHHLRICPSHLTSLTNTPHSTEEEYCTVSIQYHQQVQSIVDRYYPTSTSATHPWWFQLIINRYCPILTSATQCRWVQSNVDQSCPMSSSSAGWTTEQSCMVLLWFFLFAST